MRGSQQWDLTNKQKETPSWTFFSVLPGTISCIQAKGQIVIGESECRQDMTTKSVSRRP